MFLLMKQAQGESVKWLQYLHIGISGGIALGLMALWQRLRQASALLITVMVIVFIKVLISFIQSDTSLQSAAQLALACGLIFETSRFRHDS